MYYGDPYGNINSIVGQGYQQDAAIRGQGMDQASALTQHFIDAFSKAQAQKMMQQRLDQQTAHQQAMENAMLARQQGLDANKIQDDWSNYGTEDQVPQFNQRAQALGVPSPVPSMKFNPGFSGGTDTPNAPDNQLALPNGESIQAQPANAGPTGIDRTGVLLKMKQNSAASKSMADDIRSQAAIMKAQAYADAEPSRRDVNLARAQQLLSLSDEIQNGRIPLDQARAALLTTQNQWAPTNYAAQNAQRYASAANAGNSAAYKGAQLEAGIPQAQADYLNAGTNLRGFQGDKAAADAEAAPALNQAKIAKLGGAKGGGATPPVSVLKEGVITKFANGQKWMLQGGKPVQVP